MAHLTLQLFGTVQAALDGNLVTRFEYKKVRALLAYLALEAGQPQEREHLIGLLWPELPEQVARQNLSQALLNLREAIEDRRANPPYLVITRDTIQFNRASDYEVDVDQFKTLLAACDAHRHRHQHTCTPCARRLQQALELYQGDFLAQFIIGDSAAFEDWVLLQREDLQQRALSGLWRLAGYYESRRAYSQAILYSRRQLGLDPWREEAHRQLMRLLALDGQRNAALAQYEKCRLVLQDALGIEPEAETTTLFEIIREYSGSEGQFLNQVVQFKQPPVNLPVPSTPLIGRQVEVTAVRELLLGDEVHLVCLTGTPGIGKTRLGIEIAASLSDDFEDGVFWIDLSPLSRSDLVIPTIARALDVPENNASEPTAGLVQAIQEKQYLLLLDNFEQVSDAAPLIAEVLTACASVKMLITSRVPLHIRAEQRFPVLPLPEEHALALFEERARAIIPAFQLTGENAGLIRSICSQLDGLPLAIELIAARIDLLPLHKMEAQLNRRLAWLTEGPRDLPLRQQTLRSAIDWSYTLLNESEQVLFTRLAVFVDGCTAEAVEIVCGPLAGGNIQLSLEGLIHKSLVQVHSPSGRFKMLETIRQYAQEKLAAQGDSEFYCRRQRDWCLSLAEEADRQWRAEHKIEALDRLESEHENLRAALHWCQSNPQEAEVFLQFAGSLWRFWDRRSHVGEGRRWLEAAIRAAPSAGDNPRLGVRMADALEGAGYLDWRLGDAPSAQAHLERSLALYQAAGCQVEAASVLNTLGLVAWGQAEHDRARAFYERSLDLYRQANDQFGLARVLNNQGILDFEQGKYADARQAYEHSLAIMRRLDNPLATAWVLLNLGNIEYGAGDIGLARRHYEECLGIMRQFGEKADIALALTNLAEIAFEQGDYAAARAMGEESLALRREIEDKSGLVPTLVILGRLDQHAGRFAEAHNLLVESLSLSQELGNALLSAASLEQIARLAFAQGQSAQAARLIAKAVALREQAGTPRPPVERRQHEQFIDDIRARLGEQTFAIEWEQGRALTIEQAAALAGGAHKPA